MEANLKLREAVQRQAYPMVFVTISGAHLPERPSSKEVLNDLLVRVRLNGRFGQKVSD